MKDSKVYVIAELSANHNNDFDLAVRTIEAMAESGADAVKVQTYTADSLTMDVDNEYFGPRKEGLWKGRRLYELFQEGSMPYEWQPKLQKITEDLGLEFFSSPFDKEAIDFLEKMNVPKYKIASPEITDIPLIRYAASKQKPMIMSTGLADIADIDLAINTCKEVGNNQITILKCTSQYPATVEQANLSTIPDMQRKFGVDVGLSDHTMGSLVPVVAVSLGATMIEKHFILDRNLGGPDAAFSMEPAEFKSMVAEVRNAELALGQTVYKVTDKDKARRRSLFVAQDILKGEELTMDNIKSIRPGFGAHPVLLEEVLGKRVNQNLRKGDPFLENFVK